MATQRAVLGALGGVLASTLLSAALLVTSAPGRAAPAQDPGDAKGRWRFDRTLRIDLHHVGNHRQDRFMIDELRLEGLWPGSRTQLVDSTGYGTTLAEVYAAKENRARAGAKNGALLFSQGACSMFGEWRTTEQAKERERVFSETVRLPLPRDKVRLVLKTRNARGRWVQKYSTIIDPTAVSVSRERRRRGLAVRALHRGGAPATSLDIVILGDGYEAWQMDKYRQDAARYAELLLRTPPFSRYSDRINVWAVESPSRQSGVDEPRKGIFRDTALSMTFNTFGSPRYLMTEDNKAVRDVAANAPYDTIFIMSNTSRYGGGGIYNLYASFVSDNAYDAYVFVHEFGHSFGGLGDEYYTSKVAYSGFYPRGVEPWEPNITAARRRDRVKWADMVAKDTPVPTPEEASEYQDTVGVFEGAGYSAKGLFRPFVDCKMFNKGHKPFCPVCARAVSRMIERYLE
jgi:hypothetical protein